MIRVPSPAKLNLFLHITAQRADGYHELQTLFQLIDLCDWMEFRPRQDDSIQIQGLDQVALQQNLIFKAAQLLRPLAKHHTGVDILIEKNIPMGAGLGGGSSNAASTLIVLNQLWQCGLNTEQLAQLGLQLGADIPVFVQGKNAWAEGVGEQLKSVTLPKKQYLILKPDCFISTQLLFSQKTLTRNSKPTTFCAYQLTPSIFSNNFEALARSLYPEVEEAMHYLQQFGDAKLTGTGACVFTEISEALDLNTIVSAAPCTAYVVHSLDQSPLVQFTL